MRKLIKEADRTSSRSGSGWALRFGRTTASSALANRTRIREAYLRQGRVSEGSGPSLQLESRRNRTPRRSTSTKEKKLTSRLQGARSPSGRPQQFWQVETFEESEVLRNSSPEQSAAVKGDTRMSNSSVGDAAIAVVRRNTRKYRAKATGACSRNYSPMTLSTTRRSLHDTR